MNLVVRFSISLDLAARTSSRTTITSPRPPSRLFEFKPGVTHGLKNFVFKSSAKRTALRTVRESEIYGGVLSASLSREHLALTAELLRGDEQYFLDVLTSFIISARFNPHEYNEYVAPVVESEIEEFKLNPGFQAIETAHAVPQRLGSFAQSTSIRDNVAVLSTGIDQATIERSLNKMSTTSQLSSSTSSYFGGETRLQAHSGTRTVFVGFGSGRCTYSTMVVRDLVILSKSLMLLQIRTGRKNEVNS
ncbi:hypothetical protein J3R30DRAFT_3732306 [Lentinula aciculospora]|uniref:Cytochrome b-c1 complex subunit 2, mitochondrial n=1 Tax=Lentinula aciculospora TaxID=153920 RepID=A0A9W9DQZ4_9AGAR|nr:hypothetical protein J3R30DRAFT_3732306 [Lentinula aciculospora]